MKKIALILLAICILSASALAAPIDLSSLSFNELVALHNEVFAAIMQCDEFKEVKVPAGEYRIGTDIPAGEYTLTTDEIIALITVNEYENMSTIGQGDRVGRIVLKDGDIVSITGSMIFAPYTGLGF